MPAISEALSRIGVGLERLGRHAVLGALRPGLAGIEVGRLLRAAGLPITSQVQSLYAWKDGTDTADFRLGEIQLFPGFYFLSLEDAIATYAGVYSDPRWSPDWLPLFANGGGDFYLVELGSQPSGPIRHFRIDETEHPIEFSSIAGLANTLAAAFDRGVFYVDFDGNLEMDDSHFASLAADLNPEVSWWTG